MYKSKYPSLIEFLTNEEELILLDSEIQNIENLIDKDLRKQCDIHFVSQQRELLLAFLKCYNNGDVTEYGINEVDDFLKHNS